MKKKIIRLETLVGLINFKVILLGLKSRQVHGSPAHARAHMVPGTCPTPGLECSPRAQSALDMLHNYS
jgi:hypothetical protein